MNRKIIKDLSKHIKDVYKVELEEIKGYQEFVNNLDDLILDYYFGWHTERKQGNKFASYWQQQLNFELRQTGKPMIDKILAMGDVKVLDVGCGTNELKSYIPNLIGIDPYNEKADLLVSILDYIAPEEYDVVCVLGSINFGSPDVIKKNVERVATYCKPGGTIFWRCNPGITHDHPSATMIDFYEWTHEQLAEWGDELGYDTVDTGYDHPENAEYIRWGNRLYAEWRKRTI